MGEKEKEKPRTVVINDRQLAEHIQFLMKMSGIIVDRDLILLIMQYQFNHYENLGVIKVNYPPKK